MPATKKVAAKKVAAKKIATKSSRSGSIIFHKSPKTGNFSRAEIRKVVRAAKKAAA